MLSSSSSSSTTTTQNPNMTHPFMPNHQMPNVGHVVGGGVMPMQNKFVRNGGPMGGGQPPNLLLHSFSTNDASLGEYKYTVNVGQHNIKITGECFDLVRVS
jgi:hypothetical protein